jgi:predicted HD phosphohydrolase
MSGPTLDAVIDLYTTWAGHRYDEEVSQLDHARQTAALAAAAGSAEPLIAAALLHDIGHLLHLADIGDDAVQMSVDLEHERVGAGYLSVIFPLSVTAPIALHVEAKRYRCALDPTETERLSAGSQRSLLRQGGPMTPDQVARFEAAPHHVDAVVLRGWDDAGKVVGLDIAPFESYLPLLQRLATLST